MATDYEDIFSGEEYKYGTSLAEIRDQQSNLIQDIESGTIEGFRYPGVWSFGEDAPSFEDLTSNERFIDWMGSSLTDAIAGDYGMFGGEGYGIPKDLTDLKTDIKNKYIGKSDPTDEDFKQGYRAWFKDMGMEDVFDANYANLDWSETGLTGPFSTIHRDLFSNASREDKEMLMYRTVLGRRGQSFNPFATQQTKIEGLLDRSGAIASNISKYETRKGEVREAGLGYGKFGQAEEIEFGGTGIAGSGIREKRLGEYGTTYGEEKEGLRKEEERTWAEIGRTMRKFAEQDIAAVKQHYADVGETLETREGYFTS